MIIENEFVVGAPKQDVADYLLTPERMLYCVPGVEDVEELADGTFQATLKAKVGPIRATFKGTVSFDGSDAPEIIRATAEGRDRGSGSAVKVLLESSLVEPEEGQTTVSNHAEVTIRGRFARFGGSVIKPISQELVQDFASCVQRELSGEGGEQLEERSGIAGAAMRGLFRDSASRLGRLGKRKEES
jgi:uncharacterized protein